MAKKGAPWQPTVFTAASKCIGQVFWEIFIINHPGGDGSYYLNRVVKQ
jgi:hypothetical protein